MQQVCSALQTLLGLEPCASLTSTKIGRFLNNNESIKIPNRVFWLINKPIFKMRLSGRVPCNLQHAMKYVDPPFRSGKRYFSWLYCSFLLFRDNEISPSLVVLILHSWQRNFSKKDFLLCLMPIYIHGSLASLGISSFSENQNCTFFSVFPLYLCLSSLENKLYILQFTAPSVRSGQEDFWKTNCSLAFFKTMILLEKTFCTLSGTFKI